MTEIAQINAICRQRGFSYGVGVALERSGDMPPFDLESVRRCKRCGQPLPPRTHKLRRYCDSCRDTPQWLPVKPGTAGSDAGEIAVCEFCGNKFVRYNPRQKYCTQKCSGAARYIRRKKNTRAAGRNEHNLILTEGERKMQDFTFYFTYGSNSSHPYQGGWTEVLALDIEDACDMFRYFHPDITEGVLNCCSVYNGTQFAGTRMSSEGNFGYRCREIIYWDKDGSLVRENKNQ